MIVIGGVLGLFAALLLVARHLHRDAFVLPFFTVVPALLVLLHERIEASAFTWIKIFTLAFSMLIISAIPRGPARYQPFLRWALAGILALNILEAVLFDALAGRWWNAVVGLALVATQPGASAVGVDARRSVDYALPAPWILSYSVWNLTFVMGQYPQHWTDHLALLSAPVAAAIWAKDARAWLRARAITLSVYGFVITIVRGGFDLPWLPSVGLAPELYVACASGSAVLGLYNASARWRRSASSAAPTVTTP